MSGNESKVTPQKGKKIVVIIITRSTKIFNQKEKEETDLQVSQILEFTDTDFKVS